MCDSVAASSPAQVSCTVAGPEGSEATLVLATTDAAGAQELSSLSKQISGGSAAFTKPVPHDAAQIIAIGLVDGVEVASAELAIPGSAAANPVALGLPDITVAVTAFAALIIGALILHFGARRRSVERRRNRAYEGVLT